MRKILILTKQKADTGDMFKIESALPERIRKNSNGFKVFTADIDDSDAPGKIRDCEIIIASQTSLLTPEITKNLKWLHLTSAGANNVPKFLLDSKVYITSSSGVHPVPITEHVFGLMLMLTRKINLAHRVQIEKKEWIKSYDFYKPGELYGKKLLVAGMGRIGERIAKLADAFGMETAGVVRDLSKRRAGRVKVFAMEDIGTLLQDADFVVNCLPGTDQTKGIFDLKLFNQFKKSAYFINIGRGTTVIEKDLIKSLENGIIAGAGLDVFEIEPLPKSSPLWDLENVIITPHYSGWTPRYMERVVDIFINNLKFYLKSEKMPNLVDKKFGY